MAQEIEKKYLITTNIWRAIKCDKYFIKQGYLNNNKGQKVRVRVCVGVGGTLTVKGPGKIIDGKIVREENEENISEQMADNLLKHCSKILEKTRHVIFHNNTKIEVDEFHNLKKPLVVAEIEYNSTEQVLDIPQWLGSDVTGQSKFSNSRLINQVNNKQNPKIIRKKTNKINKPKIKKIIKNKKPKLKKIKAKKSKAFTDVHI